MAFSPRAAMLSAAERAALKVSLFSNPGALSSNEASGASGGALFQQPQVPLIRTKNKNNGQNDDDGDDDYYDRNDNNDEGLEGHQHGDRKHKIPPNFLAQETGVGELIEEATTRDQEEAKEQRKAAAERRRREWAALNATRGEVPCGVVENVITDTTESRDDETLPKPFSLHCKTPQQLQNPPAPLMQSVSISAPSSRTSHSHTHAHAQEPLSSSDPHMSFSMPASMTMTSTSSAGTMPPPVFSPQRPQRPQRPQPETDPEPQLSDQSLPQSPLLGLQQKQRQGQGRSMTQPHTSFQTEPNINNDNNTGASPSPAQLEQQLLREQMREQLQQELHAQLQQQLQEQLQLQLQASFSQSQTQPQTLFVSTGQEHVHQLRPGQPQQIQLVLQPSSDPTSPSQLKLVFLDSPSRAAMFSNSQDSSADDPNRMLHTASTWNTANSHNINRGRHPQYINRKRSALDSYSNLSHSFSNNNASASFNNYYTSNSNSNSNSKSSGTDHPHASPKRDIDVRRKHTNKATITDERPDKRLRKSPNTTRKNRRYRRTRRASTPPLFDEAPSGEFADGMKSNCVCQADLDGALDAIQRYFDVGEDGGTNLSKNMKRTISNSLQNHLKRSVEPVDDSRMQGYFNRYYATDDEEMYNDIAQQYDNDYDIDTDMDADVENDTRSRQSDYGTDAGFDTDTTGFDTDTGAGRGGYKPTNDNVKFALNNNKTVFFDVEEEEEENGDDSEGGNVEERDDEDERYNVEDDDDGDDEEEVTLETEEFDDSTVGSNNSISSASTIESVSSIDVDMYLPVDSFLLLDSKTLEQVRELRKQVREASHRLLNIRDSVVQSVVSSFTTVVNNPGAHEETNFEVILSSNLITNGEPVPVQSQQQQPSKSPRRRRCRQNYPRLPPIPPKKVNWSPSRTMVAPEFFEALLNLSAKIKDPLLEQLSQQLQFTQQSLDIILKAVTTTSDNIPPSQVEKAIFQIENDSSGDTILRIDDIRQSMLPNVLVPFKFDTSTPEQRLANFLTEEM